MRWKELIHAWRRSADLHQLNPRASLDELQEVEETLGYPLPGPLREFYRFSNGASLLAGNLKIYTLQPQKIKVAKPFVNPYQPTKPPMTEYTTRGLVTETLFLREHNWPIPAEVLVFGDTGSDSLFGIWLPLTPGPTFVHPIVEIGEVFDTPKNMAVVGSSLMPFLYTRTAYYLLQDSSDADIAGLDAMGVPMSFRGREPDPDDLLYGRILQWADPNLPSFTPDPYNRGYDAEELGEIFRQSQYRA